MRGANGDSRAVNNALETINAAAIVIASSENRVPRATIRKRRWGSFWSIYWCFGSHKHRKRIGHAVLVPETTDPGTDAPAAENPIQASASARNFVAPPSSPASFLQSEPPSSVQSPAGLLSLNSISASMYSPGGPASIFAIGPYAHETQLVSPPVFSTEPSTAPFTPPPESIHLTTPSSPEVPFARLLDPNFQNSEIGQRFPLSNYDFQSYQLYPGSPIGNLISPSSGISGSGPSSPFPDSEFTTDGPSFLEFHTFGPPELLNLDRLSHHEWRSRKSSGTVTPDAVKSNPDGFLLDRQIPEVASHIHMDNGFQKDQIIVEHRVSFDLNAEDVISCVEKNPEALTKDVSPYLQDRISEREEISREMMKEYDAAHVGETSNDTQETSSANGEEGKRHQKQRSITLGSLKEFNFDNTDGADSHNIVSNWWANEKVVGKEGGPSKNWSFFPVIQSGVS